MGGEHREVCRGDRVDEVDSREKPVRRFYPRSLVEQLPVTRCVRPSICHRLPAGSLSTSDARSRLRGPGTALLAFELGLWDRSESVPGVENHDLRVLKPTTKELPMSNWPSDTEAIDVGGGQFLLLMSVDSWVAGQPDRLCIEPVDGSLAQSCFDEGSPTDQPLSTTSLVLR